MTDDEILLGLALTVVLATGSQILAGKLRVPALIILLPVGFAAGAVTDVVRPDRLLGPDFSNLVSLSVAVILYDAGLGLDLRKLAHHTRGIVGRLLLYGVLLTFFVTGTVAPAMFGMPLRVAAMLGMILVVSGPTVVGPILDFVRPSDKVRRILIWEGTLTDPIGAILGALTFHAIASSHRIDIGRGYQLGQFAISLAFGLLGGAVGTALLWFTLRTLRLGETLGTLAQLAVVIGVSAGCDVVRDDTGLIAAILVGLAAANIRGFDMPSRRPFFETLVQLIIGLLFISISSTVTPASLVPVLLPALGLIAILVLVVRPLVAFGAAAHTDLSRGARLRRVDGPTRHRRGGDGVGLLLRTGRARGGRGGEDPSGHLPGDRGHRSAVRADGGADGQTAGRRQGGGQARAPGGRRAVGRRPGKGSAVRRP